MSAHFISCNVNRRPPSPDSDSVEGEAAAQLLPPTLLGGALGRLVHHPLGVLGRPGEAIGTNYNVTLVVNVVLNITQRERARAARACAARALDPQGPPARQGRRGAAPL